MAYYSYVVRRDFGFAPNPFGMYCTLATCKQDIRLNASVGDWIFGTGSSEYGKSGHLIFIMKVSETMTFQQYWDDSRFNDKKPIMNGSDIGMYGDNIYHKIQGTNDWCQEDSHHSYEGGELNIQNLNRDLGGRNVLIAESFVYLGRRSFLLSEKFRENIVKVGPGYKKGAIDPDLASELIHDVFKEYGNGLKAMPNQMTMNFNRYDGK